MSSLKQLLNNTIVNKNDHVGNIYYVPISSRKITPDTLQNNNFIRCDSTYASYQFNKVDYPSLAEHIGDYTIPNIVYTQSGAIGDLIYGNNLYVVAAGGGSLATSTDAITWTPRTSGTTSTIYALTYANGLYVYAGVGGVLATSTNAITWTPRTSGTISNINALTYGNGLYVYAGDGGALATSTNGITWTARTSGTTSSILALTYGNGLYVYAGNGGVLATSTNAITWTARSSGTTTVAISALTYGNGLYLYGGTSGSCGTSTDAITWVIPNSPTGGLGNITTIVYGNGVYLVGCNNSQSAMSTDGFLWDSNIGTLSHRKMVCVNTTVVAATTFDVYRYSNFLKYAPSATANDNSKFLIPTINSAVTYNARYVSNNIISSSATLIPYMRAK